MCFRIAHQKDMSHTTNLWKYFIFVLNSLPLSSWVWPCLDVGSGYEEKQKSRICLVAGGFVQGCCRSGKRNRSIQMPLESTCSCGSCCFHSDTNHMTIILKRW